MADQEQLELSLLSVADFTVPLHYLRLLIGSEAFDAATGRLGMSASAAMDSNSLPSITFCNICLEHIRAARDESLGQPQPVPFGNFALLIAAAAQGSDLADVLRRCSVAMKILRPDLIAKVRLERDGLLFTIRSVNPSSPAIEIGLEFLFVSLHCALRWMTGAVLRPNHIRIAKRFPGCERSLLTVLRCPLMASGQGITVRYRIEDAARPVRPVKYASWAAHELPEYVRLLQEAADELNEGPALAHDLAERVEQIIGDGVHGQLNVASRLGMSEATLRRRLAAEGHSYKEILERAQREEAARLLLSEMPFADIAEHLGLSDVRSFRRACIRWFNVSPAKFRQSGGSASDIDGQSLFRAHGHNEEILEK